MNNEERELDLALAEAEQENRLLRARNERLEREILSAADTEAARIYADGMVTVGHMRQMIAAERNKLATWMIQFAFATGHGDTMEELLDALGTEVVDTIDAAREDEREACAQLAEKLTWADNTGIASAIRARGQA